jgi:hypothetical protein
MAPLEPLQLATPPFVGSSGRARHGAILTIDPSGFGFFG